MVDSSATVREKDDIKDLIKALEDLNASKNAEKIKKLKEKYGL